jgi:ATP adenylyltransferase
MEQLWAPWRMEFIRRPKKDEGCFFCEALRADPSRDRENLLLERGKLAFVMMNRFPYNNGHLMISPVRHGCHFDALDADELCEMMTLAQKWRRIIARSMRAEGFNIGLNLGGAAGCGVADHVHLHLVPRWEGDTNFMPVIGDVHVIPQALAELYDQLRAELASEGGEA